MSDIIWSGEPRPEYEDLVRREMADLEANGLGHIDDLILHLIEVGDLEEGPLIEIHGRGGNIHAEYIAEPKWITLQNPDQKEK